MAGKLCITFDDGKISTYTYARPILNAAGVPATFYVLTDTFQPVKEDFSTFDFQRWDAVTVSTGCSVVVQDTVKHGANNAAKCYVVGAGANANFTRNLVLADYAEVTAYFRLAATPTSGKAHELCRFSSPVSAECLMGVYNIGGSTLQLYLYNSHTATYSGYTYAFAPDTWYKINFKYLRHGTAGYMKAELNDVLVIDNTAIHSHDDLYRAIFGPALQTSEAATIYVAGISVVIAQTVSPSYMSITQLTQLQTDGHEIASHSRSDPNMTTIPTQKMVDEFLLSSQILKSLGYAGLNFAYPYGAYNGVTNAEGFQHYNSLRIAYVPPYAMGTPTKPIVLNGKAGETGDATVLAMLQAFVDELTAADAFGVLFFHDVKPGVTTDPYCISEADFQSFIDYVVASGIARYTVQGALNSFLTTPTAFVDGLAVEIQPETLETKVSSFASDSDGWENLEYTFFHTALGNITYHSFVCHEDADVTPWDSSAANLLKARVRSGEGVDLAIQVGGIVATAWSNCALESIVIWYSPDLRDRFFQLVLRQV